MGAPLININYLKLPKNIASEFTAYDVKYNIQNCVFLHYSFTATALPHCHAIIVSPVRPI